MRWVAALSGALAIASISEVGRAQCEAPKVVYTIPPDGAADVPATGTGPNWDPPPGNDTSRSGPLLARYEIGARYENERVRYQRCDGPCDNGGSVFGSLTTSWVARELTLYAWPPDEGFEPGARYRLIWPGLRRIDDSELLGDDTMVQFEVGTTIDSESPRFAGLTSIDWDFERKYDDCSDTESERYLFDLGFPEATDDAGSNLLLMDVFQTKGPILPEGSRESVQVERYDGSGHLQLKTSIAAGLGEVCFAALVRDPGGLFSAESVNEEVCIETNQPPFFDGCSSGGAPHRSPGWPWLVVVLAATFATRARRRPCLE